MSIRITHILILLVAPCFIYSCGFQLRGQASWPAQWSPVWVADNASETDLPHNLRSELRAAGAVLAESKDQANSVIDLRKDEVGRRVLSVSRRGGPEEYELYQLVRYVFVTEQPTTKQYPDQKLVVTRDYNYDKNDILVTERDAERLQIALSDELAQRIVSQVTRLQHSATTLE